MISKTFTRNAVAAALVMGKNSILKYFQQDEDHQQVGLANVQQTYDLLIASDWKTEKVTKNGDIISSIHRENLGKIYKLRCRLKYPAKALCRDFFYEVEDVPSWNPTILESTMLKKINSYTDITYQVSAAYVGGLVKSRDFINLRCCRLVVNGKLCNDNLELNKSEQEMLYRWCESIRSNMEIPTAHQPNILSKTTIQPNNNLDLLNNERNVTSEANGITDVIRRDFNKPLIQQNLFPEDKEYHHIAKSSMIEAIQITNPPDIMPQQGRVWISAASSVEHDKAPPTSRFIRGHNFVSAFVMHEVQGKPDECIFEWLVCVDFRGNIPRYILNRAFTSNMPEFAKYLRKYVKELYHKPSIIPKI